MDRPPNTAGAGSCRPVPGVVVATLFGLTTTPDADVWIGVNGIRATFGHRIMTGVVGLARAPTGTLQVMLSLTQLFLVLPP